MAGIRKPLSPPFTERKNFENNYLNTVVCELKFPTLLSLEDEVPRSITAALRPKFPIYEVSHNTQLTPLGATQPTKVHCFSDRYRRWRVELASDSISFSTESYENFEGLIENVKFLLDTLLPFLETDFFTRIGLRYINKLPIRNEALALEEAVNSELANLLVAGAFGSVAGLRVDVKGHMKCRGQYVFKYGISPDRLEDGASSNIIVLDFDYSKEDVDSSDSLQMLEKLHQEHFPFFWWALGEKSKANLREITT